MAGQAGVAAGPCAFHVSGQRGLGDAMLDVVLELVLVALEVLLLAFAVLELELELDGSSRRSRASTRSRPTDTFGFRKILPCEEGLNGYVSN